jgi:hypothetical protein
MPTKSFLKNALIVLLVLPAFSFANNVYGTWGIYEDNLWNRAFENGQNLDVQMHTIKVKNLKNKTEGVLEISLDDETSIPVQNLKRTINTEEGVVDQTIQVEVPEESWSPNRKFQILVKNNHSNGDQNSERIEGSLYAFENGKTFAQIKRTKFHTLNPPQDARDFYYQSVFYYVKISDN